MTTNRYPDQMFSKLLVVLAVALSTCAYGFQGPAFCAQRSSHKQMCHSRQLVKPRVHNGNFTPLHVSSSATSSNESKTDQKQIIKLEKMIERENKRKEKMSEQVKLAERKMSMLNERKNAYLYGTPVMDNTVTSFKETTARSAVKAMMWRVIAGSVTFITSLRFSGSMKTALSIVGSDFFSKSLTMFIGERLMNQSNAGRKSGGDGKARSLMKALVWRIFAIANTLTVAIFVTKDLSIASKVASSDAVIKTAMMYVYERTWAKVEWGKNYEQEFNI